MNQPKQFVENGKVKSFACKNLSLLKPGDKFRGITSPIEYELLDEIGNVKNLTTNREEWRPLSYPCYLISTI